jgi:hypothetical protein
MRRPIHNDFQCVAVLKIPNRPPEHKNDLLFAVEGEKVWLWRWLPFSECERIASMFTNRLIL